MEKVVVHTNLGDVCGLSDGVIDSFLGVPYASPPVGHLRFRDPEPVRPWQGVRAAVEAGPNAPQPERGETQLDYTSALGSGWTKGDDFLTVNIWRPHQGASGLPVLVFIHGGGFLLGSKDAPVHHGGAFARDGIIVVAINYRMGVEGFLPIPDAQTNIGLRDQLCALEWVQQNIAAFGGDPDNITAAGESAGAMSLANLIVSERLEHLISKAVIQSGHGAMTRDIETAQRLVTKLAEMLDIEPTLRGFQNATSEACTLAIGKLRASPAPLDMRDQTGWDPAFGITPFIPVHGDDLVLDPKLRKKSKTTQSRIKILLGTTLQEMNLYFVPSGLAEGLSTAAAVGILQSCVPEAEEIYSLYEQKHPELPPGYVLCRALDDLVFRASNRRFAEAHSGATFCYEFDWKSPAFDGRLGACHGVELPFVFDTLNLVSGQNSVWGIQPDLAWARRVHKVWVDFVREGEVPWVAFDKKSRAVFQFSTKELVQEGESIADRFLP